MVTGRGRAGVLTLCAHARTHAHPPPSHSPTHNTLSNLVPTRHHQGRPEFPKCLLAAVGALPPSRPHAAYPLSHPHLSSAPFPLPPFPRHLFQGPWKAWQEPHMTVLYPVREGGWESTFVVVAFGGGGVVVLLLWLLMLFNFEISCDRT